MKFLKNIFNKKQKKGMGLGEAPALVTTIVVVAVTLGIGALVLNGVADSTTDANATQVINDGLSALTNFGGLMGVLGIVFISVILLGAIGLFAFGRMR